MVGGTIEEHDHEAEQQTDDSRWGTRWTARRAGVVGHHHPGGGHHRSPRRRAAGTAGAAELDSENGYVVYSVPITGADGTTVDVKIDAGNAAVLAQETYDGTEASND